MARWRVRVGRLGWLGDACDGLAGLLRGWVRLAWLDWGGKVAQVAKRWIGGGGGGLGGA